MNKIVVILALSAAIIGAVVAVSPAAATQPETFTICHVAGLASDPANYITLTLPYPAVYGPGGHFKNGTPQAGHDNDSFGPCVTPPPPPPDPTCETDPSLCPPDPTCETDPSLCPPAPTCETDPELCPPDPTCEELQNCEPPPPPPPSNEPEEPELPKAGFTSQYEITELGAPWQLTVPGNVWAGHNQTDWPAGQWWTLWIGKEFLFNGQWYTTVEYIIADPTEVELIGRAVDYDLMLITCRGYDPVTNTWAQRLVIFAELSQ